MLSNGDDTEDSSDYFIYSLKMHRKSNPANLFLNIKSTRNKFSALQHILCNPHIDLLGNSETILDDTFPHWQFHVDNHVLNPLQWRYNDHDAVSNHQPGDCLLNRLSRRKSKKTSKLRVTGLCEGNSPVTSEFPTQMANNTESVSIWVRHHA